MPTRVLSSRCEVRSFAEHLKLLAGKCVVLYEE
jgi:hypothetical protein